MYFLFCKTRISKDKKSKSKYAFKRYKILYSIQDYIQQGYLQDDRLNIAVFFLYL